MYKLTLLADEEEGLGERWIQVRERNQPLKAGERRALYAKHDESEGQGTASRELWLLRHMAAHLVHTWSYDVPPPRAELLAGQVAYSNVDSLDELDLPMENELLRYAAEWLKKASLNFSPQKDPESPTNSSGA